MSPSDLKNWLLRGHEVEFDFYSVRYTVKLVDCHSTFEYLFGQKFGSKTSVDNFDVMLCNRDYGTTLYDMLKEAKCVSIY